MRSQIFNPANKLVMSTVCFCNLRHFTSHISIYTFVATMLAQKRLNLTGCLFANLTWLLVSGHGFNVHFANKRDVFCPINR